MTGYLSEMMKRRGISPVQLQQGVKWFVYLFLTLNFSGYAIEDWHTMLYGMPENPTWLDWAGNFATSLDVLAWLALLGLFEYETYFMGDDASKTALYVTKGARFLCYIVLTHTFYAYSVNYLDYKAAAALPEMQNLCSYVGQEVSYLWDLIYTEIGSDNCEALGLGPQWFQLHNQAAVTDIAGLERELNLALTDLLEISLWLCIMAMLELHVQLQERDVTGGTLFINSQRLKLAAYLGLGVLSLYWIGTGHYLYAWDEFLWIAGFSAIEMNMSEWREEIREEGVENTEASIV
jgi:hypothetical protein